MGDRRGDTLLARKPGVDGVRHAAVRPPELRAADDDAAGHPARQLLPYLFGLSRDFLGGAEHDVALEDREAVDFEVLHRLGREGLAAERSAVLTVPCAA